MADAAAPSRSDLLQYLDSLFALAQLVTTNAEEAVRLVEKTYRKAFSADEERASIKDARPWLFRMMLDLREAGPKTDEGRLEDAERPVSSAEHVELTDFRRRLAEKIIDRALPLAFATLTSQQRLLFMLGDVERLSCEEAASVVDLEPAVTRARLDEARVALHRALVAGLTNLERHLLETGLAGNWKRAALQRMAESQFAPVPPTLRPSIMATVDTGPVAPAARSAGESSSTGWSYYMRRVALMTLIIGAAGLLGYGFSSLFSRNPDVNLISLSARQAGAVESTFQTTSPEQAERYVRERFARRVSVPTISNAALQGVAVHEIASGVEAPALLYRDLEYEASVVVYIYSYAFLDRHDDQVALERDVLTQIQDEGNFDLHDLGTEKVLIWRNRDDIFIAITTADAESLRERITFPS